LSQILQILTPIQNAIEYVVVFLFENVVSNYGIVIILLTIIVRLVLTPLTLSQTRSMARMQKIQPELKEIQKKYKDDKEKMQQETMAFYKKNNVNPLAGCLPLILQLPVFFALFQALRSPSAIVTNVIGNFTLTGVGHPIGYSQFFIDTANPNFNFLWLNLNERDPYFILVILMVATMFLSTKMTTTDPKQSIITYVLPIVFGFISYRFPSGILVYWVTTNVWSIGQQYLVNKWIRRDGKKDDSKKEEKEELTEEEKTIISRKKKKRRKKK